MVPRRARRKRVEASHCSGGGQSQRRRAAVFLFLPLSSANLPTAMTNKQKEKAAGLMKEKGLQIVVRPYGLLISEGCCTACYFHLTGECPLVPCGSVRKNRECFLLCQAMADNEYFKVFFTKVE